MSVPLLPACPAAVRSQLERFLSDTCTLLGDNLVAVYLHGSLAMGGFHQAHSDVDLLVVTHAPLVLATKRQIAEQLLYVSGDPSPIEISYVTQAMLQPWHYPPLFDFHYSEAWRSKYEHELAADAWQAWNATALRDLDLAAHYTVLNQRGVVLFGPPIGAVLPVVPRADYLAAIMDDVLGGLENLTDQPVYGILNACRTLAYLHTGMIYSKAEGVPAALTYLPEPLHPLVRQAAAHYAGTAQDAPFAPKQLAVFQATMHTIFRELGVLEP